MQQKKGKENFQWGLLSNVLRGTEQRHAVSLVFDEAENLTQKNEEDQTAGYPLPLCPLPSGHRGRLVRSFDLRTCEERLQSYEAVLDKRHMDQSKKDTDS